MAKDLAERRLASEEVYSGRLLKVRRDRVRLPDGTESAREYIRHPGAVAIVPLFEDGRVLLERQFRYPLERVFVEIPAGKLEPGEDHLETARRELLEETGYTAEDWRHLATLYPSVGYSNERVELFLARGLKHEGHPGEDGEFIECVRIGLDEALQMVGHGEITEAKTILGIFWAERIRAGARDYDQGLGTRG